MPDSDTLPQELDMSEPRDVAWVKARNDPEIWHQAAIATIAYLGDKHGFLPWLVQQPAMDRATAAWLLLNFEAPRYLRGEDYSFWARIHDDDVRSLFNALCDRSERIGFSKDDLGLPPAIEPQRQACLDVHAKGEVAAGMTFPFAILGKPFKAPRLDTSYQVHDGILVSSAFLRSELAHILDD